VTDAVLEEVTLWQSRPLERVYPIVYLDALHVKLRRERHVENCAVYVALAINMEGHKELLGLWLGGEGEGAKFWLSVLSELKDRGVEDILIASVDGLKGFPEAIAAVYPRTQVQLCVIHTVRTSLNYVTWKHRKALARELRTVYTAPTLEAAEAALDRLEEGWGSSAPHVIRLWRTNWANLTPFFSYPPALRRAIYTTNAVESIQSQLRRVSRKRGAFPTDDSVRKVLYLALMKAKERWTARYTSGPKRSSTFPSSSRDECHYNASGHLHR
jgi:putative transposase